jgi:hypothetical protein
MRSLCYSFIVMLLYYIVVDLSNGNWRKDATRPALLFNEFDCLLESTQPKGDVRDANTRVLAKGFEHNDRVLEGLAATSFGVNGPVVGFNA